MPFDREIWFYLICAIAFIGLAWGLVNTRRIIEAPFLYAVGMFLFLCPQLYVAAKFPQRVPDEAFYVYNIMVVLSSAALYYGYFGGRQRAKARSRGGLLYIIDDRRLFRLGSAVASLGLVGTFQLRGMGEIEVWRGWSVYWYTLSKLLVPGLTLILIAYFKNPKQERLLFAGLLSVFPLLAIVTAGRRSATLMLPIIYMLPLVIFRPNIRFPRLLIVAGLFLAFVIIYAFPYWRGSFDEGKHFQAVAERPLAFVIEDLFSGGKTLETIDSMIMTGAYFRFGNYDLGYARLYNSLIEAYVPGTLIGHDLKDALRIDAGFSVDWVGNAYNIDVAYYTGKSSYAELFGSFSFAGSIFFFFLGRLYRRANDAINERMDGRAIIFLCFFVTLPASLPWSQVLYGLTLQVPNILIMLFAFRWCIVKYRVFDSPASYQSKVNNKDRVHAEKVLRPGRL